MKLVVLTGDKLATPTSTSTPEDQQAISGDNFDDQNWEMLLASSVQRPGLLINIYSA